MKRIVLYVLLCLAANVAFSQITLEKKYGAGESLKIVSLEGVGDKYLKHQNLNSSYNIKTLSIGITLYNPDHSIFKTFTAPIIEAGNRKSIIYFNYLGNFSTRLFNSDDLVEYSLAYMVYDSIKSDQSSFFHTYNENGQQIFNGDSVSIDFIQNNLFQDNLGIAKIDGKYKLAVLSEKKGDGAIWTKLNPNSNSISKKTVPLIYSLPGTLPDITTSLNTQELDKAKAHLSLPMPNPSQDITRIEYELPAGVSFGEITVYNSTGFKLKSYKVDNTFGDLLLNNQDLATGSYCYQLVAGGKRVGSQKMLVVK